MLGQCEIVRDEEYGGVILPNEVDHEVDDFCSYGDVEHGDRLISYNEARVQHEGPCNGNSLPLTPAHLVGKTVHELFRGNQLHLAQRFLNSLFELLFSYPPPSLPTILVSL